MCLTLRGPKLSKKPYNKDNIRWKLVTVDNRGHNPRGPYQHTRYKARSVNIAKTKGLGPKSAGFHVYVNKPEARSAPYEIYKKVRVSGFLRSGWFVGVRCETWRRMTFVE